MMCVLHVLNNSGSLFVFALDDNDNFVSKFGHSEDYSLADALWACSNMFSNW
jgi:hypothetical protein